MNWDIPVPMIEGGVVWSSTKYFVTSTSETPPRCVSVETDTPKPNSIAHRQTVATSGQERNRQDCSRTLGTIVRGIPDRFRGRPVSEEDDVRRFGELQLRLDLDDSIAGGSISESGK